MNMQPCPLARAIGIALVASLLGACGGGGGGQLVASDPPPPVVPPPGAPAEPCPAPIAGDCTVGTSGTLLGGRDSTGRLVINAPAEVALGTDDPAVDPQRAHATYAFASGVDINGGSLYVRRANTLKAPVRVHQDAGSLLRVAGTVVGDIDNAGSVQLYTTAVVAGPVANRGRLESVGGRIDGDLRNDGTVAVGGTIYGEDGNLYVGGAFVQTAGGRLQMALPPAGQEGTFSGRLLVDGRADLAGALELATYTDAWGPYAPPGAQTFHLIHAGAGLAGTFDPQRSPGAFFTGTLRYGANDVWFDLTRVTAAAAMASSAEATPLTLASAGNVDRALAVADGFAKAPTPSQQRFLDSAGRLLHIADIAQATQAIDSLSGVAQVQLASAAFDAATPAQVAQQLDRRTRDAGTALWLAQDANGGVAGSDGWLTPDLLLGVHASSGGGADAAFSGAAASRSDTAAGLHLRRVDARGGYLGVDLGYAQRHAVLQRAIDFGRAGQWRARSQRRFDVVTLGGEVGRTLHWWDGRVTPFLRMEASTLQASRSVEAGASGFELALAAATQQRLQASGGVRLARDARIAGHALQFDATAGIARELARTGDPLRAAFTGVPGAWFDLPTPGRDTRGWLQLGLSGDAGARWGWSLYAERRTDAYNAWRFQLVRTF